MVLPIICRSFEGKEKVGKCRLNSIEWFIKEPAYDHLMRVNSREEELRN